MLSKFVRQIPLSASSSSILCSGHRSAYYEVFVVVYPQSVTLFTYRVDEVKVSTGGL